MLWRTFRSRSTKPFREGAPESRDRHSTCRASPSGSDRSACSPRAKSLHAVVVFGAVGVGVEVPRAVVADVFQKLDQPERRLEVRRAEAEVLIVAAGHLIVQIDVEQLARFPRLRDGMQEVQPGHRARARLPG